MFLVIIIALIVGIFIYGAYLSEKAVTKRKIKNATSKAIGDCQDGDIVRITGEIQVVDEPLEAPLTKRPCSMYTVIIQEHKHRGKSRHWEDIISEEKFNRIVLKDGDNLALVEATNLKSRLISDGSFESGFLNDATPELEAFLNQHGHKSEGLFGMNKGMKYLEGILEQGERASVVGKVQWKEATELGIPGSTRRILSITGFDKEAVIVTDDPNLVNG